MDIKMKNVIIAAASMVGIIVVRMILSIAFSEQVAEVFTRISVSFLFFYFVLLAAKTRNKTKKPVDCIR